MNVIPESFVMVSILKDGSLYKLVLNGVSLPREFDTYVEAESYIGVVHTYFGDDCAFTVGG